MPNKHSNAGHIPLRTCVVCRTTRAQAELLAFLLMPEGIVFDINASLNQRKNYLCLNAECYQKLGKWRKKNEKKIKKHAA